MVERIIKGIVQAWSNITPQEKGNDFWFEISCKIDDEWHVFLNDNDKQCKTMIQKSPIGSEVKFIQWQNDGDNYWRYKKLSFEVLDEGTGIVEEEESIDIETETVDDGTIEIPIGEEESLYGSDECDPAILNEDKTPPPSLGQVITKTRTWQNTTPKEVYATLKIISPKTEKKGKFNYVSWADAWTKIKENFPDATFKVYENGNGLPYFADRTGAYAKVGVTIGNIEHVSWLPVMDNKNKSVPFKEVDSMQINKTVQRAFAKAIGLHGMGLHVYRGEDLPEE